MSAGHFSLPPALEVLLDEACERRRIPDRRRDEIRALLLQPSHAWPSCCRGSCDPCVDEQTQVAREILAHWSLRSQP
jgi:hypothetical protein